MEDWIANRDRIAKNIESKIKNKRNRDEVGSPEKTETKLEEKKRKKEEETEKKEDEEVTQSSLLKERISGIINYGASLTYGS